MYCLKGQTTLSGGEEQIEMSPGLLASLAPGKPHSLSAQEDTPLLVTVAEPGFAPLEPAISYASKRSSL